MVGFNHPLILAAAFTVLAASSLIAQVPIVVTESGSDLEHSVQVEAAGRFRLVFEAKKNYGITRWYDLAGDPSASTFFLVTKTLIELSAERRPLSLRQRLDTLGHSRNQSGIFWRRFGCNGA